MATLTTSVTTGMLWSAPYELVVRVEGIDFNQLNKSLVVMAGPTMLYSWTDYAIFTQVGITQNTIVGQDYLLVTINVVDPPPMGTVVSLDVSYSDDATPLVVKSAVVCFGNVVPLALSPGPDQVDVPVIAPLVMALRTDVGLNFEASQLYLNDVPVMDLLNNTPRRPDYSGGFRIIANVFAGKIAPRRTFDEGAVVTVLWDVKVTPDNEQVFTSPLSWVFHTAPQVTKLRDPALQRGPLDQPSPIGVIEVFRQTALDALIPPRSTASASVVFFYTVQQSSLASLAPLLPGAGKLAPETSRLLPGDIAAPVEAAAKFAAVAVFWTSLLQILIRDRGLPPPVTELLDNAWNSEYPTDRGGAVAAALLYAVQGSI